ncbi:NAD-dependent epimerase/dehydratase family protein [Nocardia sp. NPDC003963]
MTTTVSVTGGTGRLGRALVPRLAAAGPEVRVLTRSNRNPPRESGWSAIYAPDTESWKRSPVHR